MVFSWLFLGDVELSDQNVYKEICLIDVRLSERKDVSRLWSTFLRTSDLLSFIFCLNEVLKGLHFPKRGALPFMQIWGLSLWLVSRSQLSPRLSWCLLEYLVKLRVLCAFAMLAKTLRPWRD